MGQSLLEAIRTRILLGDGAMGTQLQYAGLEPGGCGEAWNLDHPDRLVEAARKAGAPCVIGSMAYDATLDGTEVRTMMGIDAEAAATFMRDAGVDILALNCGSGVDVSWATRVVQRYKAVCDLPTMAQPNAGLPVLEKMKVVYKQTPQEMVAELPALLGAGVNIVGGCCGSTPNHIRLFRKILDERQKGNEQ